MDVLIVGSGPAAAAVALALEGRPEAAITVLDANEVLPPLKIYVR
jgi:2-polyprenyl-6-methoxyphenol hydroxylase-like FAD-dependent oxidoreductase